MYSDDDKTLKTDRIEAVIAAAAPRVLDEWAKEMGRRCARSGIPDPPALFMSPWARAELLSLLGESLPNRLAPSDERLAFVFAMVRDPRYHVADFFRDISCLTDAIERAFRESRELAETEVLDGMGIVRARLADLMETVLSNTSDVYEQILKKGGRAFCQLDTGGVIVHVNEEMRRLCGSVEPLGRPFETFFDGEERHSVAEALSMANCNRPVMRALTLKVENNEPVLVGAEFGPTIVRGKKVGGFACMVDLSAPKRAEKEIFDRSPIGIVKVTLDGVFTMCNPVACRIFGVSSLEGLEVADFLDEANLKKVMDQLEKRRMGMGDEYEINLIRRGDGSRIPLRVSSMPETDLRGNVVGTMAILKDLTAENTRDVILHHMEGELKGERLLSAVAKEIDGVMPFDRCYVALYSASMRHVRVLFSCSRDRPPKRDFRWWAMSPGLGLWVEDKDIVSIADLSTFDRDPRWTSVKETKEIKGLVDQGFRSLIKYPVFSETGNAVVSFVSKRRGAFDRSNEDLLAAIPLNVAVLKVLQQERTREADFRANLIREISQSPCKIIPVAKIIVDRLCEHYHWSNVSLFHVARDLGKFQLLYGRAGKNGFKLPKDYEQNVDEGVLGYVYRTREPVNIANIEEDERFKHIYKRANVKSPQMVSELCLPIITSELFWILNLEDARKNAFVEEEMQSLGALLDDVKVFLDLAWLRFFLHETLEAISDLVVVTDTKWRIRKVNPAVKKLLSFEKSRLSGKDFRTRFKDLSFAKAVEKTCKTTSDRVTLVRKDASEVDVLLSSADLPKPIGGKVFIAKDLTYQKRAEELEYLGKMFYEIAIQTKTPLSLVFSWLEGFKGRLATADGDADLERALRQLRKLELTFDRMALYDKDRSAVPYTPVLLDIQEIINEVWTDFPTAELDKIEKRVEQGLPYLRGDLFQLTFCVESILAYLLRFVPDNRKIILRVSRSGNFVTIELNGHSPDPLNVGEGNGTLRGLISRSRVDMALGEKIIRSFVANHRGRYDALPIDSERMQYRIELPAAED